MIYIRGDTHGELFRLTDRYMPGQSRWTREDVLIITGDFGFVLRGEENSPGEKYNLDALARKRYTILFLDGNHENFPRLEEYPAEIRYGGPVQRLRHNVFWLRRGNVYTIGGWRFFVMGGAYSMDKDYRLALESLGERQCWFPQELPTPAEYRHAIDTLAAQGNRVDFVLSHTAPRTIIPRILGTMPDDHDRELTGFLDWIYHDVTFGKWYCGHFHVDVQVNDVFTCCLDTVHAIPEKSEKMPGPPCNAEEK